MGRGGATGLAGLKTFVLGAAEIALEVLLGGGASFEVTIGRALRTSIFSDLGKALPDGFAGAGFFCISFAAAVFLAETAFEFGVESLDLTKEFFLTTFFFTGRGFAFVTFTVEMLLALATLEVVFADFDFGEAAFFAAIFFFIGLLASLRRADGDFALAASFEVFRCAFVFERAIMLSLFPVLPLASNSPYGSRTVQEFVHERKGMWLDRELVCFSDLYFASLNRILRAISLKTAIFFDLLAC